MGDWVKWQEKDGTEIGPLNSYVKVVAYAFNDGVQIGMIADVGDAHRFAIRRLIPSDAEIMVDMLQDPVGYNMDLEEIGEFEPIDSGIDGYWFDGIFNLDIVDRSSNKGLEYVAIHKSMTKNDTRKLVHSIKESISLLEEYDGYVSWAGEDLDDLYTNHKKMLDDVLIINSIHLGWVK